MRHELRTPLAAVRAYAELFGRGAAEHPDDLERSMKGISRESAHTPAGTPAHVVVKCHDAHATLDVTDEGHGLDGEQLAHVFERFYRTDASRARSSGGVGLGLSIVAAIATAHSGRATALSENGSGATFRVELPLAVSPL